VEHVKHKREFAPIADKVARQIGRVDRLTVHDRERIRDACDIVTMSDLAKALKMAAADITVMMWKGTKKPLK
jgi:hypothetical protein